ncbi:hypothetical protein ACIGXM_03370 [Kitasatospora sp. NPDC052896]|uniref:hypothetical protein n=1 Tax=Kitasatospora sp. NPDC052896 TaxID=3364061 RepID=UPI0037CA3ADC
MARFRSARVAVALAAAPLAAGLLLAGAGSASAFANDGAGADNGSNSSVVSTVGSGNVFGTIDGNNNWTQQTATGDGASNQNNTLGVKDNSGMVLSGQGDKNVQIQFAPIGG